MLVAELIARGARGFPDRTAQQFAETRMTFGDVDRLSNRLAAVLIDHAGVEIGSRVGLLINNSLFSIPVDFACAKARVIRVPLNARLSLAEHEQMLAGASVSVLIHGEDLAERARDLALRRPGLVVLGLGSVTMGTDMLQAARDVSDAPPTRRPEPDDVVLALFTSGTTGRLKAAQHTQSSWAAVGLNILLNLVDVQPGDAMLHAASMIHASGTFILPYWVRGGRADILPGFQPDAYLAAIAAWRPTALNLDPTMLGMLLDHPAIAETDVSSVRSVIYGASPMPKATIKRAMAVWGARFVQYYGQSEAPLSITVLSKADHAADSDAQRQLSCGRPSLDCEIRLVDEDGNDAKPGQPGEIAVRAPFAMIGYLDAPDLTASTFLAGGWVKTRDIGRVDSDGYLTLVDRTSDMIVDEGTAVAAAEELAASIARFPQHCLRADRASIFGQWSLGTAEALLAEGRGGEHPLRTEGVLGAGRFADGLGRGGDFGTI